jgi:hypothetical protein
VLAAGARTADLVQTGEPSLRSGEIGDEIARLVLWGKAVEPVLGS